MRRWTIVAIGLGVSLAFGPSGRLWAQQDSELIEQSPFVVEEEAGFAVARPIDDGSAALAPGDCDGECLAGCPACCGTCACHSGHCCLGLTCSPCNMLPHYPYFPAMHGYYYFRPYHHSHVAQQQLCRKLRRVHARLLEFSNRPVYSFTDGHHCFSLTAGGCCRLRIGGGSDWMPGHR